MCVASSLLSLCLDYDERERKGAKTERERGSARCGRRNECKDYSLKTISCIILLCLDYSFLYLVYNYNKPSWVFSPSPMTCAFFAIVCSAFVFCTQAAQQTIVCCRGLEFIASKLPASKFVSFAAVVQRDAAAYG